MEKIALTPRGLPEAQRRHSGCTPKRADEVGDVGKARREGYVGDGLRVFDEQARGTTQTRPHQVLMRRHSEHLGEHAQKMKRAQARLRARILERKWLVCPRVVALRSLASIS